MILGNEKRIVQARQKNARKAVAALLAFLMIFMPVVPSGFLPSAIAGDPIANQLLTTPTTTSTTNTSNTTTNQTNTTDPNSPLSQPAPVQYDTKSGPFTLPVNQVTTPNVAPAYSGKMTTVGIGSTERTVEIGRNLLWDANNNTLQPFAGRPAVGVLNPANPAQFSKTLATQLPNASSVSPNQRYLALQISNNSFTIYDSKMDTTQQLTLSSNVFGANQVVQSMAMLSDGNMAVLALDSSTQNQSQRTEKIIIFRPDGTVANQTAVDGNAGELNAENGKLILSTDMNRIGQDLLVHVWTFDSTYLTNTGQTSFTAASRMEYIRGANSFLSMGGPSGISKINGLDGSVTSLGQGVTTFTPSQQILSVGLQGMNGERAKLIIAPGPVLILVRTMTDGTQIVYSRPFISLLQQLSNNNANQFTIWGWTLGKNLMMNYSSFEGSSYSHTWDTAVDLNALLAALDIPGLPSYTSSLQGSLSVPDISPTYSGPVITNDSWEVRPPYFMNVYDADGKRDPTRENVTLHVNRGLNQVSFYAEFFNYTEYQRGIMPPPGSTQIPVSCTKNAEGGGDCSYEMKNIKAGDTYQINFGFTAFDGRSNGSVYSRQYSVPLSNNNEETVPGTDPAPSPSPSPSGSPSPVYWSDDSLYFAQYSALPSPSPSLLAVKQYTVSDDSETALSLDALRLTGGGYGPVTLGFPHEPDGTVFFAALADYVIESDWRQIYFLMDSAGSGVTHVITVEGLSIYSSPEPEESPSPSASPQYDNNTSVPGTLVATTVSNVAPAYWGLVAAVGTGSTAGTVVVGRNLLWDGDGNTLQPFSGPERPAIGVLNPTNAAQFSTTLQTNQLPDESSVSPDRRYFASRFSSTISIYDSQTKTTQSLTLPSNAFGANQVVQSIAMQSNGTVAVLASDNLSNVTVKIFNAAGTVLNQMSLNGNAGKLAVANNGQLILYTNSDSGAGTDGQIHVWVLNSNLSIASQMNLPMGGHVEYVQGADSFLHMVVGTSSMIYGLDGKVTSLGEYVQDFTPSQQIYSVGLQGSDGGTGVLVIAPHMSSGWNPPQLILLENKPNGTQIVHSRPLTPLLQQLSNNTTTDQFTIWGWALGQNLMMNFSSYGPNGYTQTYDTSVNLNALLTALNISGLPAYTPVIASPTAAVPAPVISPSPSASTSPQPSPSPSVQVVVNAPVQTFTVSSQYPTIKVASQLTGTNLTMQFTAGLGPQDRVIIQGSSNGPLLAPCNAAGVCKVNLPYNFNLGSSLTAIIVRPDGSQSGFPVLWNTSVATTGQTQNQIFIPIWTDTGNDGPLQAKYGDAPANLGSDSAYLQQPVTMMNMTIQNVSFSSRMTGASTSEVEVKVRVSPGLNGGILALQYWKVWLPEDAFQGSFSRNEHSLLLTCDGAGNCTGTIKGLPQGVAYITSLSYVAQDGGGNGSAGSGFFKTASSTPVVSTSPSASPLPLLSVSPVTINKPVQTFTVSSSQYPNIAVKIQQTGGALLQMQFVSGFKSQDRVIIDGGRYQTVASCSFEGFCEADLTALGGSLTATLVHPDGTQWRFLLNVNATTASTSAAQNGTFYSPIWVDTGNYNGQTMSSIFGDAPPAGLGTESAYITQPRVLISDYSPLTVPSLPPITIQNLSYSSKVIDATNAEVNVTVHVSPGLNGGMLKLDYRKFYLPAAADTSWFNRDVHSLLLLCDSGGNCSGKMVLPQGVIYGAMLYYNTADGYNSAGVSGGAFMTAGSAAVVLASPSPAPTPVATATPTPSPSLGIPAVLNFDGTGRSPTGYFRQSLATPVADYTFSGKVTVPGLQTDGMALVIGDGDTASGLYIETQNGKSYFVWVADNNNIESPAYQTMFPNSWAGGKIFSPTPIVYGQEYSIVMHNGPVAGRRQLSINGTLVAQGAAVTPLSVLVAGTFIDGTAAYRFRGTIRDLLVSSSTSPIISPSPSTTPTPSASASASPSPSPSPSATPSVNPSPSPSVGTSTVLFSGTRTFDGTGRAPGGYFRQSLAAPLTDYTLKGNVTVNEPQVDGMTLAMGDGDNASGLYIETHPDGKSYFVWLAANDGTGNLAYVNMFANWSSAGKIFAPVPIVYGQKYSISMVNKDGKRFLYVNDVLVAQGAATNPLSTIVAGAFLDGQQAYRFKGTIGDFQILSSTSPNVSPSPSATPSPSASASPSPSPSPSSSPSPSATPSGPIISTRLYPSGRNLDVQEPYFTSVLKADGTKDLTREKVTIHIVGGFDLVSVKGIFYDFAAHLFYPYPQSTVPVTCTSNGNGGGDCTYEMTNLVPGQTYKSIFRFAPIGGGLTVYDSGPSEYKVPSLSPASPNLYGSRPVPGIKITLQTYGDDIQYSNSSYQGRCLYGDTRCVGDHDPYRLNAVTNNEPGMFYGPFSAQTEESYNTTYIGRTGPGRLTEILERSGFQASDITHVLGIYVPDYPPNVIEGILVAGFYDINLYLDLALPAVAVSPSPSPSPVPSVSASPSPSPLPSPSPSLPAVKQYTVSADSPTALALSHFTAGIYGTVPIGIDYEPSGGVSYSLGLVKPVETLANGNKIYTLTDNMGNGSNPTGAAVTRVFTVTPVAPSPSPSPSSSTPVTSVKVCVGTPYEMPLPGSPQGGISCGSSLSDLGNSTQLGSWSSSLKDLGFKYYGSDTQNSLYGGAVVPDGQFTGLTNAYYRKVPTGFGNYNYFNLIALSPTDTLRQQAGSFKQYGTTPSVQNLDPTKIQWVAISNQNPTMMADYTFGFDPLVIPGVNPSPSPSPSATPTPSGSPSATPVTYKQCDQYYSGRLDCHDISTSEANNILSTALANDQLAATRGWMGFGGWSMSRNTQPDTNLAAKLGLNTTTTILAINGTDALHSDDSQPNSTILVRIGDPAPSPSPSPSPSGSPTPSPSPTAPVLPVPDNTFAGPQHFNGTNSAVLPVSSAIQNSPSYSFAVTLTPGSTPPATWGAILAISTNYGIYEKNVGGVTKISFYGSGGDFIAPITLSPGVPVHLAVVTTSAGTAYYVNGQKIGSSTVPWPLRGIPNLLIGNNPQGERLMDADVENAQIYGSALTDAQIAALSALALAPPSPSPSPTPSPSGQLVQLRQYIASTQAGAKAVPGALVQLSQSLIDQIKNNNGNPVTITPANVSDTATYTWVQGKNSNLETISGLPAGTLQMSFWSSFLGAITIYLGPDVTPVLPSPSPSPSATPTPTPSPSNSTSQVPLTIQTEHHLENNNVIIDAWVSGVTAGQKVQLRYRTGPLGPVVCAAGSGGCSDGQPEPFKTMAMAQNGSPDHYQVTSGYLGDEVEYYIEVVDPLVKPVSQSMVQLIRYGNDAVFPRVTRIITLNSAANQVEIEFTVKDLGDGESVKVYHYVGYTPAFSEIRVPKSAMHTEGRDSTFKVTVAGLQANQTYVGAVVVLGSNGAEKSSRNTFDISTRPSASRTETETGSYPKFYSSISSLVGTHTRLNDPVLTTSQEIEDRLLFIKWGDSACPLEGNCASQDNAFYAVLDQKLGETDVIDYQPYISAVERTPDGFFSYRDLVNDAWDSWDDSDYQNNRPGFLAGAVALLKTFPEYKDISAGSLAQQISLTVHPPAPVESWPVAFDVDIKIGDKTFQAVISQDMPENANKMKWRIQQVVRGTEPAPSPSPTPSPSGQLVQLRQYIASTQAGAKAVPGALVQLSQSLIDQVKNNNGNPVTITPANVSDTATYTWVQGKNSNLETISGLPAGTLEMTFWSSFLGAITIYLGPDVTPVLPSPSPSPSATPTPTPSPSVTPSPSPSPSATPTPGPSPSPTPDPQPSAPGSELLGLGFTKVIGPTGEGVSGVSAYKAAVYWNPDTNQAEAVLAPGPAYNDSYAAFVDVRPVPASNSASPWYSNPVTQTANLVGPEADGTYRVLFAVDQPIGTYVDLVLRVGTASTVARVMITGVAPSPSPSPTASPSGSPSSSPNPSPGVLVTACESNFIGAVSGRAGFVCGPIAALNSLFSGAIVSFDTLSNNPGSLGLAPGTPQMLFVNGIQAYTNQAGNAYFQTVDPSAATGTGNTIATQFGSGITYYNVDGTQIADPGSLLKGAVGLYAQYSKQQMTIYIGGQTTSPSPSPSPSGSPSPSPSPTPSPSPSPSATPTPTPSPSPSPSPSSSVSASPSPSPSASVSTSPSPSPSASASASPSPSPSASASASPSPSPSASESASPSPSPSSSASASPSPSASASASASPSPSASASASASPSPSASASASASPSPSASASASASPSPSASASASASPSPSPSASVSASPSPSPSASGLTDLITQATDTLRRLTEVSVKSLISPINNLMVSIEHLLGIDAALDGIPLPSITDLINQGAIILEELTNRLVSGFNTAIGNMLQVINNLTANFGNPSPTPLPTPTPTPTPSATPSPSNSPSPSASASASPSPSPSASVSASPSPSPSSSASASPSPSPSASVSASPSPSPSASVSASPSPSPSASVSASPSPSASASASASPSPSPSASASASPSPSPSASVSVSPSPSESASASPTPAPSAPAIQFGPLSTASPNVSPITVTLPTSTTPVTTTTPVITAVTPILPPLLVSPTLPVDTQKLVTVSTGAPLAETMSSTQPVVATSDTTPVPVTAVASPAPVSASASPSPSSSASASASPSPSASASPEVSSSASTDASASPSPSVEESPEPSSSPSTEPSIDSSTQTAPAPVSSSGSGGGGLPGSGASPVLNTEGTKFSSTTQPVTTGGGSSWLTSVENVNNPPENSEIQPEAGNAITSSNGILSNLLNYISFPRPDGSTFLVIPEAGFGHMQGKDGTITPNEFVTLVPIQLKSCSKDGVCSVTGNLQKEDPSDMIGKVELSMPAGSFEGKAYNQVVYAVVPGKEEESSEAEQSLSKKEMSDIASQLNALYASKGIAAVNDALNGMSPATLLELMNGASSLKLKPEVLNAVMNHLIKLKTKKRRQLLVKALNKKLMQKQQREEEKLIAAPKTRRAPDSENTVLHPSGENDQSSPQNT